MNDAIERWFITRNCSWKGHAQLICVDYVTYFYIIALSIITMTEIDHL